VSRHSRTRALALGNGEVTTAADDAMVAKYVSELSRPLLDRIDLQIEFSRFPFDDRCAI
jgi:predicted ATPase with chaperone activity